MPELGALTVAIREQGGQGVVNTLKEVDRTSQATAANAERIFRGATTRRTKATAAEKALQREIAEGTRLFSLQARTVDVTSASAVADLRAAAAAQIEWLQGIRASTEQQTRFNAVIQQFEGRITAAARAQQRAAAATVAQAQQAERAQQRLAAAAAIQARQVTAFGQVLNRTGGQLTSFGRSGLTALNAVAFGISQLSSMGETSFRSLATAAASFAAFFGPQGAIVSIVTSAGLAISDFFLRSRREIEATKKKAVEEARALKTELDQLQNQGDVAALEARAKVIQGGTAARAFADGLKNRKQDLEVQKQRVKSLEDELKMLTLLERMADPREKRLQELKSTLIGMQAVVDALETEFKDVRRRILEVPEAGKAARDAIKITAETGKDAEEKRRKAIEEQINALQQLAAVGKLRREDLVAILPLEEKLNAELRRGTTDRLRRAEVEQQLVQLAQVRLQLADAEINKLVLKPLLGPAGRIEIPEPIRLQLTAIPTISIPDWALKEAADAVDAAFESLPTNLANVLGDTIGAAFSGGMGNAKDVLLRGLGGIMMQMGQALLTYGLTMSGLLPALLNPFTSGPAAMAAGAALIALGGLLGGIATGSGGGGGARTGAIGKAASDTFRSVITDPNDRRRRYTRSMSMGLMAASGSAGPTIEVLGVRSAKGQREISKSRVLGKRRGLK